MFWQREYLRQGASLTLNSTYQVDLPANGNLGSIILYISGPQDAALGVQAKKWRICDFISKIEVIADGSEVIKSITGKQAQALGYLDQGVVSPDMIRNYAANDQRAYFLINFGRFLKDFDYGLVLEKFNNVELKITNDATATEFTSLSCDIMCYYLRDVTSAQFKGCMYTEVWRDYIPVASGVQYLELPTNWLIRRILLNPLPGFDGTTYKWYTALNNLMYNIELSFKTGVERVWKDGFQQLMICNYLENGKYVLPAGLIYQSADTGKDIGLGYTFGVGGISASKDGAVSAVIPTIEADTSSNILSFESYEADAPISIIASGMGYHSIGFFDFDKNPDPSTWLNTRVKDVVKLDITTRSTATVTDAHNKIVVDRLVA